MGDLSQHFSRWEFACHGDDGCTLIDPPCALLVVLEQLRAMNDNRPLSIISGYRCEAHNDAVGGAFDSRHLHGDAADVPGRTWLVSDAEAAGAVGIGADAAGWVLHVDVRPGPPARWIY